MAGDGNRVRERDREAGRCCLAEALLGGVAYLAAGEADTSLTLSEYTSPIYGASRTFYPKREWETIPPW